MVGGMEASLRGDVPACGLVCGAGARWRQMSCWRCANKGEGIWGDVEEMRV